jgi:hypothetical protein
MSAMKKRERRLIREASKALAKLAKYRDKHRPAASEAALAHVVVSARLCGWPQADAQKAACLLLSSGVDPRTAAERFGKAVEWQQ